jgi:PTS system mannose-specific IIA component
MIGILLITHGKFGEEMVNSAISIIGKQEKVASLTLPPEKNIELLRKTLIETINSLQAQEGTLILTDMYSTTACNLAIDVSSEMTIEVISGVNLYMLITALTKRNECDLKKLKDTVIEAGKKNIMDVKSLRK